MQSLDIDFHKTSSKNTVFAINRAIRSIETALRFTLGFATPVVIEFFMLVGMMTLFCGPKYLANMMLTLGLYTYFSKAVSELRRVQMESKKNAEKKTEFYLNESTINFESVKNFGNENLEQSRYRKLLDDLESKSLIVQNSLG
jgi:ABC-type transport system involved in Fe-S cluster assembly fused permease/ATPase subunit